MEIITPVIVILTLLLIIYLRIKKQQELLEKVKSYEALLRDCRVTRWKYFQCMEKSKEALKIYEQMSDQLTILKAELLGIRSELRDELRFLRAEMEKSNGTELDKRTIVQMQAKFDEKWKFLSSRKTNFNETLDKLIETKRKMEQATQDEIEASSKWSSEKERIMDLWRELNSKVQVTDPHKYFS